MKHLFSVILFLSLFLSCIRITPQKNITRQAKAENVRTEIRPHGQFKDEALYSTTYLKDKIFVGTGDIGHLFSFEPSADKQIKFTDYGLINPKLNQNLRVHALINDGKYIYGGSTDDVELFFFQPDKDGSIKAFGGNLLKKEKISLVFSPVIYDYGRKHIFFGTYCRKPELKIIHWIVGENGPSTDDKIEIFNFKDVLPNLNTTRSIGLTTIKKKPVLVIGTTSNKFIIFYLDGSLKKVVRSIGKNYKTFKLLAVPEEPNYVWFFYNGSGGKRIVKYDLAKSKYEEFNAPGNPGDQNRICMYLDGYIYTSGFRLSTKNNLDIKPYSSNMQKAYLVGTDMVTDGKNIFAVQGVSGSARILNIMNKNNLVIKRFTNFSNTPKGGLKPPYGGGAIFGFAVYKGKIYGGAKLKEREFIYDSREKKYQFNSFVDSKGVAASQADAIFALNGTVSYGLYDRPYFAFKPVDSPRFKTIFDMRKYLEKVYPDKHKAADQHRIKTISGVGKFVFFGTAAEGKFPRFGEAALFVIDVSKPSSKPIPLGRIKGSSRIESLSAVPHPKLKNHILVYGATGSGKIFIFNFDTRAEYAAKNIVDALYQSSTALLADKNHLYKFTWGKTPKIIRYEKLPLTLADLKNVKSQSVVLHNGIDIWGAKMVKGNDGFLFVAYSAIDNKHNHYSYVKKIEVDKRLKIAGVVYNNYPLKYNSWGIVNSISADTGDKNNKKIYLGLRGGSIKIIN